MKTAAVPLYLVVNVAWALVAYLLHRTGVPLKVIGTVVGVGAVFGNLAVYAGVKIAAKIARR